uniref:Phosphoglycerate mutase n=1 Tax=Ascaris lumbricoides TaxID=6252 RepID=A0A0M3HZN5_ASCLU
MMLYKEEYMNMFSGFVSDLNNEWKQCSILCAHGTFAQQILFLTYCANHLHPSTSAKSKRKMTRVFENKNAKVQLVSAQSLEKQHLHIICRYYFKKNVFLPRP